MKILTFLVFAALQITSYNTDGAPLVVDGDQEEYYWKRYTGTIPPDAVPGGLDVNDNVTYIGQTFLEGSTVPGELHDDIKTLYFEFNGPRSTKENIKILCSRYTELFEWIKVTEKNYKFLWSKHIVQGGFYHVLNIPFLIGRIPYKNKQLIVAEVLATDTEIQIHFTADGVANHVKNNFDLLSFNERLRVKDALKKFETSNQPTAVDVGSSVESKPTYKKNETACISKQFNFNFT